jgi:hypothetical protein
VRGNERKLDPEKSTPLEPVLSLRESDVSPLPANGFVEVTIPLYYEGHAYRAGSRIRVTIAAPNGTQPIWAFAQTQPDQGGAEVAIAYGQSMPSRLLLPVVPGLDVPTALPPCPGLRGEPCRDFLPLANRSVDPPTPAQGEAAPAHGGGWAIHTAAQSPARTGGHGSKCGKRPHRKPRHNKRRLYKRRQGKHRHKHGGARCHHKRRKHRARG